MNHTLSLAIPRSIWARHLELNPMRGGEGLRGVIKLTTIVALDGLNDATKLSGNLSEEVEKRHKSIRL